jgi:hypothetical protein
MMSDKFFAKKLTWNENVQMEGHSEIPEEMDQREAVKRKWCECETLEKYSSLSWDWCCGNECCESKSK